MSDLEIQAGLGRSPQANRTAREPRRLGVTEVLAGLFSLFLVTAALFPTMIVPADRLVIPE